MYKFAIEKVMSQTNDTDPTDKGPQQPVKIVHVG